MRKRARAKYSALAQLNKVLNLKMGCHTQPLLIIDKHRNLMASIKKNLPNIPIYIGDWERDCNVLSLEAEAAWLRIVFKLWTKGKQNAIKMPAKSLQRLWGVDATKMNEILEELQLNDICDLKVENDSATFVCRRFVKENDISEIRSRAAKSKSKTAAKPQQNTSKPIYKNQQNTEIEIENEKKEKKGGLGEKGVLDFKDQILEDQIFIDETCMGLKIEKQKLFGLLDLFISQKKALHSNWSNFTEFRKNFYFWIVKYLENEYSQKSSTGTNNGHLIDKTQAMDVLNNLTESSG